jgi:hypothetical protein
MLKLNLFIKGFVVSQLLIAWGNFYLILMWVTGLTDSEGSFIISIYKRKETNNWQINPSFQL